MIVSGRDDWSREPVGDPCLGSVGDWSDVPVCDRSRKPVGEPAAE